MIKMESHVHQQQLAEIEARRIAYLRWLLDKNPDNQLLKKHLQSINEKNDKERLDWENQQNQCWYFS